MASVTSEVDALLRKTMKLLHSSHSTSATDIRMLLDDIIKPRYGSEKMLCNTLSKRQLEKEHNFPGRATTPVPQKMQITEEIINLTNSPTKTISDSPETIIDSDDDGGNADRNAILTTADDDVNLKEFGDLSCCVCGEIMFTATNRLIECSKCGTLYHQDCHKPPITDEQVSEGQESNWQCDNCSNKPNPVNKSSEVLVIPDEPISLIPSGKTKSPDVSDSNSSSNSSSPFFKQERASPMTSKSNKKSSSSTSKSSKDRASSNSSKSSASSTSVNLVESKRKDSSNSTSSKTSSKSSKHHDTKRKGNK